MDAAGQIPEHRFIDLHQTEIQYSMQSSALLRRDRIQSIHAMSLSTEDYLTGLSLLSLSYRYSQSFT